MKRGITKRENRAPGLVTVTDSAQGNLWFGAHVGESFEVEDAFPWGFVVVNPYGSQGHSYSIPRGACEPADLRIVIQWAEDDEVAFRVIESWIGTQLQCRSEDGGSWLTVDDKQPAGAISRLCARRITQLCNVLNSHGIATEDLL